MKDEPWGSDPMPYNPGHLKPAEASTEVGTDEDDGAVPGGGVEMLGGMMVALFAVAVVIIGVVLWK